MRGGGEGRGGVAGRRCLRALLQRSAAGRGSVTGVDCRAFCTKDPSTAAAAAACAAAREVLATPLALSRQVPAAATSVVVRAAEEVRWQGIEKANGMNVGRHDGASNNKAGVAAQR